MLRKRVLQILSAFGIFSIVSYFIFISSRANWRGDVEFGNTEAYSSAFDANYGWAAWIFELNLALFITVATIFALLLFSRINTWKDVQNLRAPKRIKVYASGSLASLLFGLGLVIQMIHDMNMWRPPPWADSPGIVLMSAVGSTLILLVGINLFLTLFMIGGKFPNSVWAKAEKGTAKIRSIISWVVIAICVFIAIISIVSSQTFLIPSALMVGYTMLLARGTHSHKPAT